MPTSHFAAAVIAAFLASLVEFVEALTIVLAAGAARGWRSALLGAGAAVLVLAGLVAVFGSALQRIPIEILQVGIGAFLLWFGYRWLKKAVLRSAGIIALHDEAAIFERQSKSLAAAGAAPARARLDGVAFAASFNGTFVEGLEVVLIVIAVGAAGRMLVPASLGAAAAGLLVLGAGVLVHRPLEQVPENLLKYTVGLILVSFGLFWLGEGAHLAWPGGDWSLLGLFGLLWIGSRVAVALAAGRSKPRNG